MIKTILLSFALLGGALLHAATLVSVTIDDFGDAPVLDRGGEPVSLYHLEIGSQVVPVLCVDDAEHLAAAQTWTAIMSPLADLRGGKHSSSPLVYSAAAWLYTQDSGSASTRVDIQNAAWALFDPGLPLDRAAFGWKSAALAHGSSLNLAEFFVISGRPGAPMGPEFLFERGGGVPAAAPEPNGFLIVCLLCVSLSEGLRRARQRLKRKRQAEDVSPGV